MKNRFSVILSLFIITSYHIFAQSPIQVINNKYVLSQENTLQEKLFVQTDKDFYLAGDILWFKLYNTNNDNHQLIDFSKVAYVEVLDLNNKPILQAKIALKKGTGSGSFYLPISLSSGNYSLRAYTNWMKNFSPDLLFEKNITIVNTLKEETLAKNDSPADYTLQFFPEGGNLINDLRSKVAFRAVDDTGKGIRFSGAIINQNNDTIVRFQPYKFGLGTFYFTPKAKNYYKAIIKPESGKTFSKSIPSIQETGYVMQLDNSRSGKLKITIQSNTSYTDSIYLFIHGHQQTKTRQSAWLSNNQAEFMVDSANLGDGISHFTVFNKANQPLCERVYFKKPSATLIIDAVTDKSEYLSRKKVTISIAGKDELKKDQVAQLSVSVFRADPMNQNPQADIASYFWLSSNLKGNIENPDYYLNNNDPIATENLMLTHGWSRFKWDDVLTNQKKSYPFSPELDGHIITGRLVNSITESPSEDNLVYLSVAGKKFHLYGSRSKANGEISFYTKNLFGSNELIAQTDTDVDSISRIEINNPFLDKYSNSSLPTFNLANISLPTLSTNSFVMQVSNVYNGDYLKREILPSIDSSGFFRTPNKAYKLDDYVRFTTMEEILREYIPEINVTKRRKTYTLSMVDMDNKTFFEKAPFILFDGVPIFSSGNKVIALDPLKVERLEVVDKKYFYGPFVFDGIANFTTYKKDLAGLEIDKNATIVDYEGLQLQREFYSPMYGDDSKQNHTPDLRSTLYWSPNVSTGKDGKGSVSFYTSDQGGDYIMVLQGISANGKVGSKTLKFAVNGLVK
ncbi:MAG: hypothetical protein JWN56_1506 [Sphingobacteriales bacterium]|nr:hypothetical protein [Sphingobacteriales bacterium]